MGGSGAAGSAEALPGRAESASAEVAFADPAAQYRVIREQFLKRLERVTGASEFVLSAPVTELEEAFAEYCETAFCVGVNSGTDALALALRALGVGPGDEVALPANTFVATAEAVCHAGARPLFVDVDEKTRCLDPGHLEERIGPRTRAVVPVHLYGNPAPMDEVLRVARSAGLGVIEDACQAHGARYRGERVGSLGDAAAFSFYPGKNLGALGDAGAVVTGDPECAQAVRRLRNHGGVRRHEHRTLGFNSRLDAIQAIALTCKLPHLDAWNRARRACAAHYRELLAELPWLRTPSETPGAEPVYHLFPVEVVDLELDRDRLLAHLEARGIRCGVHYPQPLHELPAFAHLGYRRGELPVAERAARRHLSLPLHPGLDRAAVERVASELRAFAR